MVLGQSRTWFGLVVSMVEPACPGNARGNLVDITRGGKHDLLWIFVPNPLARAKGKEVAFNFEAQEIEKTGVRRLHVG